MHAVMVYGPETTNLNPWLVLSEPLPKAKGSWSIVHRVAGEALREGDRLRHPE